MKFLYKNLSLRRLLRLPSIFLVTQDTCHLDEFISDVSVMGTGNRGSEFEPSDPQLLKSLYSATSQRRRWTDSMRVRGGRQRLKQECHLRTPPPDSLYPYYSRLLCFVVRKILLLDSRVFTLIIVPYKSSTLP